MRLKVGPSRITPEPALLFPFLKFSQSAPGEKPFTVAFPGPISKTFYIGRLAIQNTLAIGSLALCKSLWPPFRT
jgi:hypothetical protein